MLQPNSQENKFVKNCPLGGLACNTQLNPPKHPTLTTTKLTQTTTSNRLQSSPTVNSSTEVLYSHFDYLAASVTTLPEELFQDLLQRLDSKYITTEETPSWSRGTKARSYEYGISSPKGIAGGYNKIASKGFGSSSNTYEVAIDIKGSYLANLTPIEQYNLLSYLTRIEGIKFSRIDLAIDDNSYQKIPLEEMKQAYKEGNNFGFRHHWDEGINENGEVKGSRTEYFGGRTSAKIVRVYDHKGKCLRLEAQLRGKRAEAAIKEITSLKRTTESDEEWNSIIQKTIGGIAVGAIDFRDKNKLRNPSKADKSKTKRLPFWQQFIDEVGKVIKLKPTTNKVKNEALESKINWFNKYAKKTLAQLALVHGDEYVLELIKQGKASLTAKDHKEIEYWKSEINS